MKEYMNESLLEKTTTNAYVDFLVFHAAPYKTIHLVFKNTGGVNGLKFKILGSLDNGVNYDYTVLGETTLAAGVEREFITAKYYTQLKVQFKASVADAQTTATLKLAAHIEGGTVSNVDDPLYIQSADGALVTLGTTTGAAVVTDANGTIQQYLRGLVKLVVDKITANIQIGGVVPGLDNTNEIKISAYGKSSAAGDTPLKVDSDGHVQVDALTDPVYTTPATGELVGIASATQLPSVTCKLARFKARWANTGNVYLGITGVTRGAGTTTTTCGFELGPGDDTGWIPIDNINRFYRNCDDVTSHLTYMTLS